MFFLIFNTLASLNVTKISLWSLNPTLIRLHFVRISQDSITAAADHVINSIKQHINFSER